MKKQRFEFNPAKAKGITRGVEAYQGGKNQDALDWFNKEISEHPDNGYAYVYTSILRYGNQEYGKRGCVKIGTASYVTCCKT